MHLKEYGGPGACRFIKEPGGEFAETGGEFLRVGGELLTLGGEVVPGGGEQKAGKKAGNSGGDFPETGKWNTPQFCIKSTCHQGLPSRECNSCLSEDHSYRDSVRCQTKYH